MVKSKIKKLKAREILDSRGIPTVEVELTTSSGKFLASVPSGTSTGKYEAFELRDEEERYQGKGVKKAVKNVNEIIAPKLIGEDVVKQKEIDEILMALDGTKNKSKLGANAVLGVSMAVARAGAASQRLPLWKWLAELAGTKPSLPKPCILCIEGGKHGAGELDVQEFMIIPNARRFKERLQVGTEIYKKIGKTLSKKYGKLSANVGLEGAFTPKIKKTEEALELIVDTAEKLGHDIDVIIDVAASSFYEKGKYVFDGKALNRKGLLDVYSKLCRKYPITGIEDPYHEDDWIGFKGITQKLGKKVVIIGDDLLATNILRIKEAAIKKTCNGLILKPNQIGTVSEVLEAGKIAMKNRWKVFVKHRSGETKDDFISDLAVGLGTGWIMAGAPTRGERVAKYNRLLKIEEEWQN